jgi:hypothetical protein
VADSVLAAITFKFQNSSLDTKIYNRYRKIRGEAIASCLPGLVGALWRGCHGCELVGSEVTCLRVPDHSQSLTGERGLLA